MASLADKVLPQEAQDKIANITAQAQSGAISWADANKQANEVRAQSGANYTVGAGGTTTYNDGSTISNYSSGSVASGGAAKDYLDQWSNNATVSDNNKDYLTNYGYNGPNMSRNPAYAGQKVKVGHYTITYGDHGYPISAVEDDGASATSSIVTTHANDSPYHQAAYQAALMGDWDLVGEYMNKIADMYGQTDKGPSMQSANLYMSELQDQFRYDDEAYYNRLYDQQFGAGSAATFDATGGAIKTYAELVEKAGGADKAQQILSQYTANTKGTNTVPGLSLSTGLAGTGGVNDMRKYLEDMFAQNLEAELSALKSAYDSNVAELESQNDAIAEQYRAARNQAAAQNALEVQSMNERALATGLNTGTSGQIALAQNMAYQGNLGNLWAQEAQQKAESDRLMAEMLRDYNANVNQVTATSNAKLAEALYNEMIRQQEMAAAAEAARIKQEQADREWAYMLEQDALDRQLAYAQLAAKNAPAAPKGMSLSTAKAMAEAGQLTDEVVSTLLGEGYNAEYLASEYGYVAPSVAPVEASIPQGLIQSIGMNRTSTGQMEAIKRAAETNQITEAQAAELLLKFGLV